MASDVDVNIVIVAIVVVIVIVPPIVVVVIVTTATTGRGPSVRRGIGPMVGGGARRRGLKLKKFGVWDGGGPGVTVPDPLIST
jgi:hypothetical protein